jgi:thymidylate kinase
MTERIKFIKYLFDHLKTTQYVLLKHIDFSIEEISEHSDLDILISKENFDLLYVAIKNYEGVKKIDLKHQNTMSQIFLFFKDNSYLQLDFLFGFYRKGLAYLQRDAVFKFSKTNEEGIQVCNNRHLLEHLLLFNFLNYSGIPKKYLRYFEKQSPEELQNISNHIKTKYNFTFENISDLKKYDASIRKALVETLFQKSQNKGFSFFKNRLNYVFDVLKNIFSNRGFIMTFSGVDGAGKSTIIENVKEILEGKYRRDVVVLRHRPSILPILSSFRYGREKAEQKTTETLPRQGKNENRLNSLIRFSYYYFDYLLGQFFVKAKYVWRGNIVIYDRYYFDFIVDGKRSNIQLPKVIPTFLYRFVSHPSLNLFLYANPETILKRKKELDAESIDELTSNYKTLFETLKNKSADCTYLPIENTNKEKTLQQIIEQYEALV